MRSFAIFLGLIALGLAGIAVLGYPAWLLTQAMGLEFKFHRVASRIAMLTLLVGFVLAARRLEVADRQSLGFGLPARSFAAETGKAILIGALLMLPILATMVALDMRQLKTGVAPDAMGWLRLILVGAGYGPGGGAHRGNLPARRHADRDHARVGRGAGHRAAVAAVCGDAFHRPLSRGGRRRGCRQRSRHAGRCAGRIRAPARHRRRLPVSHRSGRVVRPGAAIHRQHRRLHRPACRLGGGDLRGARDLGAQSAQPRELADERLRRLHRLDGARLDAGDRLGAVLVVLAMVPGGESGE